MRNKAETTRVVLISTFLFMLFCIPVLIVLTENWFNVLLLIASFTIPIVIGGLFLSKNSFLQNPPIKFAFTWILSGFTIFFVSVIVLIVANYSLKASLTISSKLGLAAMAISLLWHLMSLMFGRILSGWKKK